MEPFKFVFSQAYDGYLIAPIEFKVGSILKRTIKYEEDTPIKVNPSTHIAIVSNSHLIQLNSIDYRIVC